MTEQQDVKDILEAVEEGLGHETIEKAELDTVNCCEPSCKCLTMSLGVFVVWALYATALAAPQWTVQDTNGMHAKAITQQMGPLTFLTSYTFAQADGTGSKTVSSFGLLTNCDMSVNFDDDAFPGDASGLTTTLSTGVCHAQQALLATTIAALAFVTLSMLLTCLTGRKGFQSTQRYAAVTALPLLLSWISALVALVLFSSVHEGWAKFANEQTELHWETSYGNGVYVFMAAVLITPLAAYPSFSSTLKMGKEWSRM